ncbi:MAG: hypothetical protein JO368_04875, partial [Acidimicrobiales bacterium]|nr:hypothetical protein [Acidimicrobiales bacterium]
MWLLLLVLAVAVLGVLLYLARRGSGEEHSVRDYQGTLATMEQVESRAAARTGGPSRPVRDPGAGEFASPADEPAVREVGATGRPVVHPARLVFDDSVTAE